MEYLIPYLRRTIPKMMANGRIEKGSQQLTEFQSLILYKLN